MPKYTVVSRRPATRQCGSIGFVATEEEETEELDASSMEIMGGAVVFFDALRIPLAAFSLRHMVRVYRGE